MADEVAAVTPIPAAPAAPAPAAVTPAPAAESSMAAKAAGAETAAPAAAPTAPSASPSESAKPDGGGATVAPTATPAPVEAAKPAEAAKPTEPTPEKPASLLGTAGETTPPAAEAAPAKPEVPAPAAPLPSYDAPKLPEGLTLQAKALGEFDTLLGGYEATAKADHTAVADLRQKLVDMYVADRQRAYEAQRQTWADTRKGWVEEIKNDRILGGNRLETVKADAAIVRDLFATPRFREMIEYTGAGDHPGMWEFVHNIARYLDKRGLLREAKAVPATRGMTQAPTKKERRYGAATSGNGAA